MTADNVIEYVLDNGLKVILKPIHSAPVVSNWIWYRVGARNEVPGQTGISHWVEHMMFKGTPTFPKGTIMKEINRNGGTLNGFTGQDYTAYFETLPENRLELGLKIESDRMANCSFEAEEVDPERTVIIAEREGNENSPSYLLFEETNAVAYRLHPYGHPVIGWKEDLHRITRDDLWGHYKMYYGPHNAVVVIAGDFEVPTVKSLIDKLYGPTPAGPPRPTVRVREPAQRGLRRVNLRQPGMASYFLAAFHVADGKSEDTCPLILLNAILSGAKSMAYMGSSGGTTHRSARIYQALVETQLAVRAGSSYRPAIDPGLFYLSGTVRAGHTLDELERAFLAEIDRLYQEGVSEEEVVKARKQARAQFAYATESASNQAYWLGIMEMLGDWRRFDGFLDELEAVTVEDVDRVARRYLTLDNGTIGWFIHQEENGP
jgi:zinc protease